MNCRLSEVPNAKKFVAVFEPTTSKLYYSNSNWVTLQFQCTVCLIGIDLAVLRFSWYECKQSALAYS